MLRNNNVTPSSSWRTIWSTSSLVSENKIFDSLSFFSNAVLSFPANILDKVQRILLEALCSILLVEQLKPIFIWNFISYTQSDTDLQKRLYMIFYLFQIFYFPNSVIAGYLVK